jgi:1-acyl-sn-glycerol-3-phosphate acyltransferase
MTVRLPSVRKAATARNLWQVALRTAYTLHVIGGNNLMGEGPLLVIVNDSGPLTSPVLRSVAPRPIHHVGGDIPWHTPGLGASWMARNALIQGRSVSVGVDLPTAGALALMSESPMALVRISGAHGRIKTDPARPGSRISVEIAPPLPGLSSAGPLTAMDVRLAHTLIRQRYADTYKDGLRNSA